METDYKLWFSNLRYISFKSVDLLGRHTVCRRNPEKWSGRFLIILLNWDISLWQLAGRGLASRSITMCRKVCPRKIALDRCNRQGRLYSRILQLGCRQREKTGLNSSNKESTFKCWLVHAISFCFCCLFLREVLFPPAHPPTENGR